MKATLQPDGTLKEMPDMEKPDNNQDDLWKEIYEVADKQVWVRFEAGQDVSKTTFYRDMIDYLKKHFIITRKH